MDRYQDDTMLREARAAYFLANEFGADGGYAKDWEVFELGPLPLPIPNGPARVAALRYHDLHHILTGYETDWRGEFEISAFEVGAGCGRFWFAWLINLGGLAAGLALQPRRTLRAYARGAASGGLYRVDDFEALLDRTVGDVRSELGLDGTPTPPRVVDLARAGLAGLVGLLAILGIWVAPPTAAIALVVALTTPAQAATAVDLGLYHGCAVTDCGDIACWGWGGGAWGAPPRGTAEYIDVVTGSWHTCALRVDGRADCWGPNAPFLSGTWVALTAGVDHTCGVRWDGSTECVGSDAYGQLLVRDDESAAAAAGAGFTCTIALERGVSRQEVRCVGNDSAGQASPPRLWWPEPISLSAGWSHACALGSDGSVICWGEDGAGQRGPAGGFGPGHHAVDAGIYHSCRVDAYGAVHCWGSFDLPGGVHGETTPPSDRFVEVAAGYNVTCGLTATGRVLCWGDGRWGQTAVPEDLDRACAPVQDPTPWWANLSGTPL